MKTPRQRYRIARRAIRACDGVTANNAHHDWPAEFEAAWAAERALVEMRDRPAGRRRGRHVHTLLDGAFAVGPKGRLP
jgi:hypothetical protein